MLEKLFGSKARVKILKLFLLHSNEKYYIRQLSRDLNLQLNSVRRELENLEKFGILTSDAKDSKNLAELSGAVPKEKAEAQASQNNTENSGGQEKKYYRADTNFVLYNEIKALIVKAQILYEKDFVQKLQEIGKIKLLVLTGIFANNPSTLTDILLVGKVNKDKLLKLIKQLEKELGKEINYTLFTPEEFKYRREITDIFLYEILESRKLIVIDEVGLS